MESGEAMPQKNEFASRSDIHLLRRLWHVACGVICFIFYYFFKMSEVYWGLLCVIIALLGFIIDFKRLRNKSLNESLTKVFGPILRKSEKFGFSGLPFYALGAGMSLFFFEKHIAILSILFLVFADPIASIIGFYFGKDRLFPNKTLQGTIACFLTCFVVCLCYCFAFGHYPLNYITFAFLASLSGALAELLGAFRSF